jgi:hypothetical protein
MMSPGSNSRAVRGSLWQAVALRPEAPLQESSVTGPQMGQKPSQLGHTRGKSKAVTGWAGLGVEIGFGPWPACRIGNPFLIFKSFKKLQTQLNSNQI